MGDPTEGAGAVDTVWKAYQDIENGRFEDFAMDGVALGLDALGVIANPLGGLLSAGIGWLIEHLDFLREPLDALAGDPGAVMGVAATWGEDVKAEVARVASDFRHAAETQTASWTGEAADSYRKAAAELSDQVASLEAAAAGVAEAVQGSGMLVATVRGIIRDIVAEVVAEIVLAALTALATSWFTLGGSIAAFTGWAVARGAATAGKIAGKIAKLLTKFANILSKFSKLRGAVQALGKLAQKFKGLAQRLGKAAAKRGQTARAFDDAINSAKQRWKDGLGEVVPDRIQRAADQVDGAMGKLDRDGLASTVKPGGLGRTAVYEVSKEGANADENYEDAVKKNKEEAAKNAP